MDFQTMRIYGSIAIILGCFLFLYPKLLHPVFMSLLGLNTGTEGKKADDIPPALRDRHPGGGDLPEHIRKMRGPHPGMRAAAAEQSKQQTKGSGRGMMGVILPMYAVGIVVYLCYTLFKVFGKNDKSSDGRRSPAKEGTPRSEYSIGPEGDDQEEMDMRKLQERLAETEAQMTRILAAMQAVQTKVDDVATEKPTRTIHHEKEEDESKLNTSDRSSESSPESESFEIVSKSDHDSGGEECRTRKVETLTSTTVEEQDKKEEEEIETEDNKQEEVEGEDEEPTEEIIRDKEDDGPEEEKTVRKRIPKTEDVES